MNAIPTIALKEIIAKKTGSISPSKFRDEIFDLYSIPAFDSGEPDIVAGGAIGSTKQIVKPNDVLLSKIVPHIRRSWVVGKERGRRIIASGEWIVFRSPQVHPRYLRQVLVGDPFHAEFMNTVSGVGGSLLRARPAFVANIKIPLPPLPEQRRIADILDKAEALRAKRREALAELDGLAQAIFIDMFGDPKSNPKEWPICAFRDMVSSFRYGTSVKSQSHGKPTLRIPNVIGGGIDLTDLKLVPVSEADFERLRLKDGDILFVRTNGNPNNVGRCAAIECNNAQKSGCDFSDFIFASYLIRARLKKERLNPVFLREFLQSNYGRHAIMSNAKTSAGQYNINIEGLKSIAIQTPPPFLQHEFVDRIKYIEVIKASHHASLTELDALFASLQHRAFRGEL